MSNPRNRRGNWRLTPRRQNWTRDRDTSLPADLAAALGITTHSELVDLLDSVVSDVIREETGGTAGGTVDGLPVRIVGATARKPRLAD
jgi:hypothetical protein